MEDIRGLRVTFPATLVSAFWLHAAWAGGPGTAGSLIPAVGGRYLEKGKGASGAKGGPAPTPGLCEVRVWKQEAS